MNRDPLNNRVLLIDNQYNHLDQHYLLVPLVIVQHMQYGLRLRKSGDHDDHLLIKGTIMLNEDLQQHSKV